MQRTVLTLDALKAAVELSQRYLINRRQPDKSIDLIDEAAAKVRMAGVSGQVCEDDIREILSKKTGIPVEKIGTDEAARLMNLEQSLADLDYEAEYAPYVLLAKNE